ncbi:hypothetical protein AVEN_132244-1 [Araneus ventricosus]|uniref:Reverse transcriptase RNase H-like domain-containing protein n=1 Tax=Araneus ventricosus TaxID=182803 RepID=A0A4Y2IKI4_ARAVE|nr:hypothetical protein AVEN_132244-1 [Araneus ventricosus]
MGVILAQKDDNDKEHPVLYLSKKFSENEKNYSTTEREFAAIIFAVKKLQCYLDGHTKFLIMTDHNPLVWLKNNGRIATADKKKEGTETETQSNSSQVLSLTQTLEEANFHQPVDKPGQNELAATRSQIKLSYTEAANQKNKIKKPTLLLYPSGENDKEIEEILTEQLKVNSTNFKFKILRKFKTKHLI